MFPTTPLGSAIHDQLVVQFQEEERAVDGQLAVAASRLDGSDLVSYRGTAVGKSASTIKLPLLIAWLEGVADGQFGLDEELMFEHGDPVPGSGVMQILKTGKTYAAIDLAHLMICLSDNTATNILMRHVSVDRVNDLASRWGWNDTQLYGPLQVQPPSTPATTTPNDLHAMMLGLWNDKLLPRAETELAKQILFRQQYTDNLGRFLDFDRFVGDLPVKIASKSGSLAGLRNEVAVIEKGDQAFALGIMVQVPSDPRFYIDHPAHGVISRVTKLLADTYLA